MMETLHWRKILKKNRYKYFKSQKYDLCVLWRALAFRKHEGEPEPIVRARAFENVLKQLKIADDGGKVFGNCKGFTSDTLPDGFSDEDFNKLALEHNQRGQRDFWAGFDHSLADYPTLLSIGITGYRNRIKKSLQEHTEEKKQVTLRAIDITLQAFSEFIHRGAQEAASAGSIKTADACAAVALNPPMHFSEAVQLIFLTHLVFKTEGRCHMALGRLDQYLLPFYQRDIKQGYITEEETLDLLCHLWVRLDEIGEVQNICIGGLTPGGQDATNALSYLCLEATRLVQSPHTNLSARFHDDTSDTFHKACFNVIRTGIGFPAIFNDHVLIQGLEEIGIPSEAARDTCMVGCIETMIAGRQPPWSDSRFNTPLFLIKALHKLIQKPQPTYEELELQFRHELAQGIVDHIKMVNGYIKKFPPGIFPDPFLSGLTRDCINRGLDVNDGGAEFNRFHGIAIMGLATIADSLAAVKRIIFDQRLISFSVLMTALDNDFAQQEELRLMLVNKAPKYGNNDPFVDNIAAKIILWSAEECLKHHIIGGGRFVAAMAANVQNIDAGREVGATPDGRHANTPLSDAASPYFGRDLKGPTAFINSVSVPDYHQVLTGSVINMRFNPDYYRDEASEDRFLAFTKAFVENRIPELQFNFSSDRTLLDAQQNPEKYRNLVVRVSGFSARFVELSAEVQADILRRKAHV